MCAVIRLFASHRYERVQPLNMSVEVYEPSPLQITERAAEKVRLLIEEEANPRLHLRVFVTGGGCSGFQYGFSFDEDVAEDDTTVSRDGVRVVVDALSIQYLAGAEVDYTEGLDGSKFTVSNPNAKTTCGCGSSFSV
jgi:iron-sulfur cluster insertion protein